MHENYYDEIINNLFIGNMLSLQFSDKFSMIVNCTEDEMIKFPENCKNCIRIPIEDDPLECNNFLNFMMEINVLEKMNNSILNNEKVLVHCFAGRQRSCALVACYLIKYYQMNPTTAIKYIIDKRRVAFFGGITFISSIVSFYYNLIK